VHFSEQWQDEFPLTIWEISESKPAFEKLGVKVKVSKDLN
jgi:hypothetical protein